MKKTFFALLILSVLLTMIGCIKQEYTFEQGFKEVLALDLKYNGSFYDEAIDPGNLYNSSLFLPVQGRILVPLENIDPFIIDLDLLKEKVSQMKVNNHTTAVLQLIELREKMLEMERYYVLGEAQKEFLIAGPKRSEVISIRGFGCKEGPKIIETAEYYNTSANIGKEAVAILDNMLNNFQNNPNIPNIMGLDNKDPELNQRPKFIDSPFWPMIKVMNANAGRIKQLCYSLDDKPK